MIYIRRNVSFVFVAQGSVEEGAGYVAVQRPVAVQPRRTRPPSVARRRLGPQVYTLFAIKKHNFVYTETNPVVCVYVRFVYLWPYEWETLSKYAVNDTVVLLKRTVLGGGTVSLIIEPGT